LIEIRVCPHYGWDFLDQQLLLYSHIYKSSTGLLSPNIMRVKTTKSDVGVNR